MHTYIIMESPKSNEKIPAFSIQAELEKIPEISHVSKVRLSQEYLSWAEATLPTEIYEEICKNYALLDVHKYHYTSDNLSIAGYIWVPKNITEALPITVWNRGGTCEYGSTGERIGTAYSNTACELARMGTVVVASEYRGGHDSEGNDEWGGADLRDVVRVKEIADKLPFCKSGKALVAGVSRGGMMSYLLASQETWVKAVISLSGTTDLIESAQTDPTMKEVFAERFGGSQEDLIRRSATYFYPKIPKDLPLLILHGTADDRVSVEQVRHLHELLKVDGHTVEYHEFPEADHALHPYKKEISKIIKEFVEKLS